MTSLRDVTSVWDVASVRDVTSTQLPTANCQLPTPNCQQAVWPSSQFFEIPATWRDVKSEARTDRPSYRANPTSRHVTPIIFSTFFVFLMAYGSIVPPPGGTSEHSAPPFFGGVTMTYRLI